MTEVSMGRTQFSECRRGTAVEKMTIESTVGTRNLGEPNGLAPIATAPEAVVRIEGWLLHSDVQIEEGSQRGGVAGWLNADGEPDYVYLEIAGYYLTAMAWLASGAACSAENAETARVRARLAADWIGDLLARDAAPPTRLYLSGQPADWRNDAVFSFDLAMAMRGLSFTRGLPGRRARRRALTGLCTGLERISSGAEVMQSHEPVLGVSSALPQRWSTRPGPHHLKAAAAVLRSPEASGGRALATMARNTCLHWTAVLRADGWPCQELHALLYGLEGMLILNGRDGDGSDGLLADAEAFYRRLMELQAADGTLPETVGGGIVRSDVLAQALRVGMLLRGRGRLEGAQWNDRLHRLADALVGLVQPDGGVLFARHQDVANTWCAMFAHQALYLYSRRGTDHPAIDAGYDLLV
jgi:hypothetical protein